MQKTFLKPCSKQLVCGKPSFQHEMLFNHVCKRFCCTQASKYIGVSLWWQNQTL